MVDAGRLPVVERTAHHIAAELAIGLWGPGELRRGVSGGGLKAHDGRGRSRENVAGVDDVGGGAHRGRGVAGVVEDIGAVVPAPRLIHLIEGAVPEAAIDQRALLQPRWVARVAADDDPGHVWGLGPRPAEAGVADVALDGEARQGGRGGAHGGGVGHGVPARYALTEREQGVEPGLAGGEPLVGEGLGVAGVDQRPGAGGLGVGDGAAPDDELRHAPGLAQGDGVGPGELDPVVEALGDKGRGPSGEGGPVAGHGATVGSTLGDRGHLIWAEVDPVPPAEIVELPHVRGPEPWGEAAAQGVGDPEIVVSAPISGGEEPPVYIERQPLCPAIVDDGGVGPAIRGGPKLLGQGAALLAAAAVGEGVQALICAALKLDQGLAGLAAEREQGARRLIRGLDPQAVGEADGGPLGEPQGEGALGVEIEALAVHAGQAGGDALGPGDLDVGPEGIAAEIDRGEAPRGDVLVIEVKVDEAGLGHGQGHVAGEARIKGRGAAGPDLALPEGVDQGEQRPEQAIAEDLRAPAGPPPAEQALGVGDEGELRHQGDAASEQLKGLGGGHGGVEGAAVGLGVAALDLEGQAEADQGDVPSDPEGGPRDPGAHGGEGGGAHRGLDAQLQIVGPVEGLGVWGADEAPAVVAHGHRGRAPDAGLDGHGHHADAERLALGALGLVARGLGEVEVEGLAGVVALEAAIVIPLVIEEIVAEHADVHHGVGAGGPIGGRDHVGVEQAALVRLARGSDEVEQLRHREAEGGDVYVHAGGGGHPGGAGIVPPERAQAPRAVEVEVHGEQAAAEAEIV